MGFPIQAMARHGAKRSSKRLLLGLLHTGCNDCNLSGTERSGVASEVLLGLLHIGFNGHKLSGTERSEVASEVLLEKTKGSAKPTSEEKF